jgi:5-methylcytosine-specific restriction endonuclease McrA
VAARHGWRCTGCTELLDATYHVDHIVPLWAGGDDTPEQCQPLCPNCHARKTQAEAIARGERNRRLRAARRGRPTLLCTRCGRVLSSYFLHECAP